MNGRPIINYVTKETKLGFMLVGTTDKGVCTLHFGDNEKELVKILQQTFPGYGLSSGFNATSNKWLTEIESFFSSPKQMTSVPLDVEGTEFQKIIWSELQKIPSGDTVSYSDIALRINRPTAVRAVASACAQNKIAVLIPCHRVIGKDGSLSGYRWGLERKAALLRDEANALTP